MNPIQYKGHSLHFFKRAGGRKVIVTRADNIINEFNGHNDDKLTAQAQKFIDCVASQEDTIAYVTELVGKKFRTFGGGKDSGYNPISSALKDAPFQFAGGVDVREVVTFILQRLK